MMKLSLAPRPLRWGALILSVLPVFFVRERLAAISFRSFSDLFSGRLEDWCALVVAQELVTLVLGFRFLQKREFRRRIRFWEFSAFLPSLMLPVAAVYAEAFAFNTVIDYDFDAIMWTTALTLTAAGVVVCELLPLIIGLWRGNGFSATLCVTWFLVLLATFLPTASAGGFSAQDSGGTGMNMGRDLAVLGVMASVTAVSGTAAWYLRRRKRKGER